eukprot:11150802-Alexandrium_andersonii.AAC.1
MQGSSISQPTSTLNAQCQRHVCASSGLSSNCAAPKSPPSQYRGSRGVQSAPLIVDIPNLP